MDHSETLRKARYRHTPDDEVDEFGEKLTPAHVRVMQQKEEYWEMQEANYDKWFSPKKYGNVMSEFTGTVRACA